MLPKTRLSVETLESREVPATASQAAPVWVPIATPTYHVTAAPTLTTPVVPATPVSTGAPTTPTTPTPQRFFTGTGTGTYISSLLMLSTPSGFHLTGRAHIAGMGEVELYGHFYTVGFSSRGNARGELRLMNSRGSITLTLTGPEQTRLSVLPSTFTYRVTRVTGSYSMRSDTGTLRLTRTLDAVPIRNGIRYFETGSFRITI